MRREVFALLLLSLVANAALSQSYVQVVTQNGTSTEQKTMQVSIFGSQLTSDVLARMESVCSSQPNLQCSVDANNKTVTFQDSFQPGGYYTYTSDYGLPFITNTLTITKIPIDRFNNLLQQLLISANVSTGTGNSGAANTPIDLRDNATNIPNAQVLTLLKANITYTITMPTSISQATVGNLSGTINGSSVQFDLIQVLEQSKPIVIKTNEPNLGYLTAIAGIIVIVALALSFMSSKSVKRKK